MKKEALGLMELGFGGMELMSHLGSGMSNLSKALAPKSMVRAPKVRPFNPQFTQGFSVNTKIGEAIPEMTKESGIDLLQKVIHEMNASKPGTKTASVQDADIKFVDGLISGMDKTAAVRGLPTMLTKLFSEKALNTALPISMLAMSGLGLGGTAMMAGKSAYDSVKDAVKSHMSYKQMFKEFPELEEMPRAQVDKYWGVLNDFAPKLTTNPLVAGQFISNMASFGMRGIDHNVVGQLAQISGNIANARGESDMAKTLSGLGSNAFKGGLEMMSNADAPTP